MSGSEDFRCAYRIEGLWAAARGMEIYGVDSLQALMLALQAAISDLETSEAFLDGRLTFLGSRSLA